MTRSDKPRHRDFALTTREISDDEVPRAGRIFRMTDDERQRVAKALRYIDDARRALQGQQNAENREIIRELRASADEIYDVINELEEIES